MYLTDETLNEIKIFDTELDEIATVLDNNNNNLNTDNDKLIDTRGNKTVVQSITSGIDKILYK